jgi:hypothetical protein
MAYANTTDPELCAMHNAITAVESLSDDQVARVHAWVVARLPGRREEIARQSELLEQFKRENPPSLKAV